MIFVAICDDEKKAVSTTASACERLLPELTDEPFTINTFLSPVELLESAAKTVYDLILCDVYMPGLLGTDAMQELRDKGSNAHIIFLPSSTDHAVDAFALHADNYLVKPFTYEQFSSAVTESVKTITRERKEFIVVKAARGTCRLDFSEIVYIETDGHYQLFHMRDGSDISTHSSSQALYDRLSFDERFYKAGSSFILNWDMVRSINNGDAILVDESIVTIPVRLRKAAADAFFAYSMGTAF